MFNLIRMNIYRMIFMKGMRITLLCTILFAGFAAYMSYTDTKYMQEETEKLAPSGTDKEIALAGFEDASKEQDTNEADKQEDEADFSFGIYVETPYNEDGSPADFLQYYAADLASGTILIFTIIAAALFVAAEEKSGFVKNIAGQARHRGDIYLAKLPAMALYILGQMLFYGLVQYIVLRISFAEPIPFGASMFKDALIVFLIDFLLYLAFASGIMMFTTVFRTNTISITVGMLSAMGASAMLFSFVGRIIDKDVCKYMVTNSIKVNIPGAEQKTIILTVIVGFLYLIVYNGIGTIIFAKRDVV